MNDTEPSVSCRINGSDWTGVVGSTQIALDFLRDTLRMTGTKRGCEWMVCGACTVLIDGRPTYSCNLLAADLDGVEIRTVDGLADEDSDGGRLLQEAFARHVALQCGYCTPGQLMNATALIESHETLTREEIDEVMRANICRCGSYVGIIEAIKEVHDKVVESRTMPPSSE